jgi:tripartite-type tricarboxylate transporter receptor subunit TctC
MLCAGPLTLTVNAEKTPVNDVKSFVALAKSRTKPLFYGTLGPGSVTHLYGIVMSQSMGFDVTDIAYRNNPASILDMLSGECDLSFATPSAVLEQVKAGKLKILALSTEKRMPNLSDIPSFAETGYPQLTASFWTALHAPAGTPAEIVGKLNEAANTALTEIAKLMEIESYQIEMGPPKLLDEQLTKDVALWGPVVKSRNIVLE